jgi:hypothetical protein
MVVVAKSSNIEGLTRIQIMPYWWTTAQWRQQYPPHIKCNADISMETIKGKYRTEDSLFYCPTWTAGMKKGRPKANAHEKGISDYIKDSGKKRKRTVRYFCKICHKYNHNTKDCYKNPVNNKSATNELELGSSQEEVLGNNQQENEINDGQEGMA